MATVGPTSRPPVWFLERFGLLEALSPEHRALVEQHTTMRHFRRGAAIYLPGDRPDYVYVVKRGAVKIVGRAPEGGDVILTVLSPGDLFGELALVDGDGQDHCAEAADDTLLCQVPRELLVQLMREAPAFGLEVNRLIGRRLRTFGSRVEELLGKSAAARLAHTLLDLARRHGVPDEDGVLIPLGLSQGDLGKLVGLARETINGIVQAWREQGLVEMDRRRIRLRDLERLRRVR